MTPLHVEPENRTRVAPEGIKPRRKGIYLLPNLMTTGCLFSGFYAIVAAIDKQFRAPPARPCSSP